jgi:hypothetical protein
MNKKDRAQALDWYAVKNYDLTTIAQHFGMTRDELARELRTVEPPHKCTLLTV